jgi:hypothetical protein
VVLKFYYPDEKNREKNFLTRIFVAFANRHLTSFYVFWDVVSRGHTFCSKLLSEIFVLKFSSKIFVRFFLSEIFVRTLSDSEIIVLKLFNISLEILHKIRKSFVHTECQCLILELCTYKCFQIMLGKKFDVKCYNPLKNHTMTLFTDCQFAN